MNLHTVSKLALKEIRSLLSHRDGDDLVDFLVMIFERYNELLHSIDDSCVIKQQILEEVRFAEHRIYDAINDYYSGNLAGATVEIQHLHWHFQNYMSVQMISEGDIWYRGRVMHKNDRLFTRKEMFHIPNNKRENVSNQRFSFNGYPSLYLGKTIWDCWEEMGEPHLDDICFSAFKATRDIKLANLSLPTEEIIDELDSNDYFCLLSNLPLIMSCSIKTQNENANFKAEYIIPQLLMVDLINIKEYDGYMFTSTKRNAFFEWNETSLHNVVLPVSRKFDEEGLCIELKQKFLITSPICYKYEFLKGNVSNLSFVVDEDIDNMILDKPTINNKDCYPDSLFGQMEKVLKEKNFLAL